MPEVLRRALPPVVAAVHVRDRRVGEFLVGCILEAAEVHAVHPADRCLGADAEGKEELEPKILKDAIVVVDDIRQASAGGEINVPISKGIYSVSEIYATLADVVAGKKAGRLDNKAITVFDSTGVAIEDIAVAKLIYERAQQAGRYPSIDLVGA